MMLFHSLLSRSLLTVTLLSSLSLFVFVNSKMTSAHLEITKTWNGHPISSEHHVSIDLKYDQNLTIEVSSPFYNNPHLPDFTNHPRSMDKLYNYEVVEVFLLGENDQYLEIELGPRGQYLVLELKGYRNVTRYPIDLPHYESKVKSRRWTGSATIPKDILPPKISRINCYAIYGTDPKRTYLALSPAPSNNPNYTSPDFHRLELFQPIFIFNKN